MEGILIEGVKAEGKEDFLKLSMREAISFAYTKFKSGEWDEPTFNKSLRAWWVHTHPSAFRGVKQSVEKVFDIAAGGWQELRHNEENN